MGVGEEGGSLAEDIFLVRFRIFVLFGAPLSWLRNFNQEGERTPDLLPSVNFSGVEMDVWNVKGLGGNVCHCEICSLNVWINSLLYWEVLLTKI